MHNFGVMGLPFARTGLRPGRIAGASAGLLIALVLSTIPAAASIINIVDVIPNSASAENGQNSEPSLAVNPLNPNMMVSGTFTSNSIGNFTGGAFWNSVDGGMTWTSYGSIDHNDKSLAWRQDGVEPLAVTMHVISDSPFVDTISTFQGGASSFGSAVNISPQQSVDQPWIRTGTGGQTYVTFNSFNNGPKTASIEVSSNNGTTYNAPIVLETVNPLGFQDAPSVRSAVNGNTVYAAFTRWGSFSPVSGGDLFSNSQVVVVKSTNAGATFSAGTNAATTTGYFSFTDNTSLTLGQERTSSDLAIAVAPNNADRVVVAYGDRIANGQLVLKIVESTDGGLTWSAVKFTTPIAVRSALPGLTILANGDVALLYASYDPTTDSISQHLVTTTDDFATTTDSLLGTESTATPQGLFDPYLGDFYDLTSVDNTLFGIFSASNADNGSGGLFPSVTFQRDFIGTPGTPSFQLTNSTGGIVPFSIDPFVFSLNLDAVPEPSTLTLLGGTVLGLAVLRRRRT
jgi:hypothetical protein